MFSIHIQRCLTDNDIRLRPVRIVDARLLYSGFHSADFLKTNGLAQPISSSWFSLWWWIKKTFTHAYCIVINGKSSGFIGVHKLCPGLSAAISLSLFEVEMRRKGYGMRSFQLLVRSLQSDFAVKRIFVRVRKDNLISLAFWKELGFKEMACQDCGVKSLYYVIHFRKQDL
jgi:RimJ/RimL family protein N-acetyltransferase